MNATPTADAPTLAAPRRVLVLRSCRPTEFAAAIRQVRARSSRVHCVALSHRGHRSTLMAAGIDSIIELPGRRFSVLRIPARLLLRLRRERFDEIVLPQMTASLPQHTNLYRVAAAIGASTITIVPANAAATTRAYRGFVRGVLTRAHCAALWALFQRPVFFLALLAAACVWPHRKMSCRRQAKGAAAKRRVLHVISSLGVGGAQRQLAEFVNRTPPDRYDVDVLVLGSVDGDFSRRWIARSDVRITYVDAWPRLVDSVLEVRRLCIAGRYDLVHTWLFMANVVGVAGARLAGVPHVIESVRNLSLWKRTWYAQWWFRAADILSARAADAVTVNAEALKSDHGSWAWYPPEAIDLVHNGLEPSKFLVDVREARLRVRTAAGLSDEAPVIGTVGRLAPEKDHDTFLRIVRGVHRARPDVRAVIVGDGQLRQQLEAAATAMGLADVVTFLGERLDARTLMAGLDVFVLPSRIEGFPNVLLEAAFLGVPAVASRVGGSPDVLPMSEDTFAAGDAETAARRVLQMLEAPESAALRAAEMRDRAFSLFTADRTAARWFELYDRCVSEEALL